MSGLVSFRTCAKKKKKKFFDIKISKFEKDLVQLSSVSTILMIGLKHYFANFVFFVFVVDIIIL